MKNRFRRALDQELGSWVDKGFVNEDQAARLAGHYALDRLDAERRSLLLNTIFLIGVVLIGCGVVAFVAAHWENISKYVKVALLLLAMAGVHAAGYWLWKVKGNRPRLGHALTVLGTLIFGANIALFAQVFHISGELHAAYLAWGAGALVMAYSLGSVPNAVVAIGASFVGFGYYIDRFESAFILYPFLAAGLCLPLCYLKKSVLLFFLVVAAAAIALITNGCVSVDEGKGVAVVLPFPVTLAALWCYGRLHSKKGAWAAFGSAARALGALGIGGTLFFLAFYDIVHNLGGDTRRIGDWSSAYWWALASPLILIVIPVTVAVTLDRGRVRSLAEPLLAGCAVVAAVVLCQVEFLNDPVAWSVVAVNIIAVGLSAYGIWIGLKGYERLPYWSGLGLAVLLIMSRFFEYESHLLVKSAGFAGAGVALIVFGVLFENRLRRARKGVGIKETGAKEVDHG